MDRLRPVALLAALALIVGAIVVSIVPQFNTKASEIVLGSFSIQTVNAAGEARLTKSDADAKARAAAGSRLGETIATLTLVNERAITEADLQLVDSVFAPAAKEVKTPVSNFQYKVNPPEDIWVFIDRVQGVTMPDWGISNGAVEAQVVVEDKTGKAMASIARYNPAVG